jgi:potassium efflux system protein
MKRNPAVGVLLALALTLVPARPSLGQQTSSAPTTTTSSAPATATSSAPAIVTTRVAEPPVDIDRIIERVKERVRQTEQDKSIDDATRSKAVEAYNQALKEFESAKSWAEQAAGYEKEIAEAQTQLEQIKEALKVRAEPQMPPDEPGKSLSQLQVELDKARLDLSAAKEQLTLLEAKQKYRSGRRAALKLRQEQIDRELKDLQPPEGPAALVPALTGLQGGRTMARMREKDAYEKELLRNDATAELLTAQLEAAKRQVTQAEKLVTDWEAIVNKRRGEEDAKRVQAAMDAFKLQTSSQSAVREVLKDNLAIAEKSKKLSGRIEQLTGQINDVQKLLDRTRQSEKTTRDQVKSAGVTRAMGLMLRRERKALAKTDELRQILKATQRERADCEVELLELRRRRDQLPDIKTLVDAELARLDPQLSASDREKVAEALNKVYETQRTNLDSLIDNYNTCTTKLIDLESISDALITEAEAYAAFIDQHILWLRSHDELRVGRSLRDAWNAAGYLTGVAQWVPTLRLLGQDARSHPVSVGGSVIVFLLIIGSRRRLRIRLEQDGDKAAHRLNTSFVSTVTAIAWTAILAISWPLLFWLVAWRLSVSAEAEGVDGAVVGFCKALSVGLRHVGLAIMMAGGLRELCRPKGLGEAHLGWSRKALQLVRRNLLWLMIVGLPVAFVISVIEDWQLAADWKDSLSRLAFLVGMAALTVFAARILWPSRGIFRERLVRNRGGLMDRLRYLWYFGLVSIPVVLAGLTADGFYYTSLQLTGCIQITVWFVLFIAVLRGLVLRWVFLMHRSLAIAQARKRLAEKQAEPAREAGRPEGEVTVEEPQPELDIAALSGQTRQLFVAALALIFVLGIWFIWIDVLPALGFLRRITVYSAAGITLADVALAMIAVVMTLIASRNGPAFLEITVLPHLPLTAGGRYAVITVFRYLIIIVGVLVACGLLGISWGSVQWLVAAMTVGLGFGLQEIFANFVSGLILLFERPIRVGDIVTVGDISGTISRIHIRATTIISWDRKELIIPNKEFVTGKVMNWTLSDQVLGIVIPVGVAYGSNADQVEGILRQVIEAHPDVLKEPVPTVFFVGFGASSLDFEIRVFIAIVSGILAVRHQLLNAIDREFSKAGIEIPFPQRDIHIRSVKDVFPVVQKPAEENEK